MSIDQKAIESGSVDPGSVDPGTVDPGTVDQLAPRAGATAHFDSLDPSTGELVGSFPVADAATVQEVVAAARIAATWWRELGFTGRRDRLLAWRRTLAGRIDELAALVHRENGKSHADAVSELAVAVEHLDWAAKHAANVLARRKVRSGILAINHAATVEYQPYGVVGVIGPWNYPVHTPLGSISYALAAGNSVVFKPSEFTPAIGQWLADSFAQVVPEHPVFSVVTGLGETGNALCQAGVDKLAFTGSTATGKLVMAACAASLTPVLVECGGKDAMIVAADADVAAAADAAVWGAFANSGQTCAGVERVYAVDDVYDRFLAAVADKAGRLRPGHSYGPITMPRQAQVIAAHVAAATRDGGRAVVGGPEDGPEDGPVDGVLLSPAVFADVPEWSVAVQEETFGPTITVARVRDEQEAIARANGTRYGLGAAVFSAGRGRAIADQLHCGMVSINSVLTFAMVPELPFGGVGDSGFGRIHGRDGLREFAWAKAITVKRAPAPINVTSYDRPRWAVPALTGLVKILWGRRPPAAVNPIHLPGGHS